VSARARERRRERRRGLDAVRRAATADASGVVGAYPQWSLGGHGFFRCERCPARNAFYGVSVVECWAHDALQHPVASYLGAITSVA
jgi:hypothetical protein